MNFTEVTLYYHRHSTYKNEQKFLSILFDFYPSLKLVDKKLDLELFNFKKEVNINHLVSSLKNEKLLAKNIKNKLLKIYETLPEKILIAKNLKSISIDFTLQVQHEYYFFEYHENQHKLLCNRKKSYIFSLNEEPIIIPKYAQQFLRDIWRIKNIKNYKIIWDDWFMANSQNFTLLLDTSFHEYNLDGMFSYTAFLEESNQQ